MKYILIALLGLTGCSEVEPFMYLNKCSEEEKIVGMNIDTEKGTVLITTINYNYATKTDAIAIDNFEEVMKTKNYGDCSFFEINLRLADLERKIEKDKK
jgi:hypothetical protein